MFTLATDTSCDELKGDLDSKGIAWIPLTFTIDGVTYPDDFTEDAQYEDFYAKIRAGAMPTTSQINTYLQEQFFEKLVSGGARDVVYLTLSSGLSSSYASACAAAKNVCDRHDDVAIHVVDTLSATQGHRLLLHDAIKLRDQDMNGEEAARILRGEAKKIHHWIIIDDLYHLKAGGRVSGAAAAIGTLLKIKPILIIDKVGSLKVVHKAMGTVKAMRYVLDMMDKYAPDAKEVYLALADAREKAEQFKPMLLESHKVQLTEGWVGPVIGAHTGCGMLGVVFKSELGRAE